MLKIFSINLNKTEGHAEKEARWRRRREGLTITVFLLIFVVLSLYIYQNHKALGQIIQDKQDQIQTIQQRLEELQKSGKDISKGDVLTLARMEKERFLWGSKLKALSEILPQEVVLTLLEYNNRELRIKAISKIMADEKEFDKVSELMDMLKSTPFFYREFSNIRFTESHRVRVENQEILSITINCSIEKPALVPKQISAKTKRSTLTDKQTTVKGIPEP